MYYVRHRKEKLYIELLCICVFMFIVVSYLVQQYLYQQVCTPLDATLGVLYNLS